MPLFFFSERLYKNLRTSTGSYIFFFSDATKTHQNKRASHLEKQRTHNRSLRPSCSEMSHFCLINSDSRWDTFASFLDPPAERGIISKKADGSKVSQLVELKVD